MKITVPYFVMLWLLPLMVSPVTVSAETPESKPLPASALRLLALHDWHQQVGEQVGIWVDATQQRVLLIQNNRVLQTYRCATGAAGMGSQKNSGQTPLGWHRISHKIGDKLPVGAILKARQWTQKVWQPGQDMEKDLVLTRILWLRGLEPGKNLGGEVDSWSRYIYIHGTNHVQDLGRPTSHGCIRLDPGEVIDLFNRVEKNTRVLITGTPPTS